MNVDRLCNGLREAMAFYYCVYKPQANKQGPRAQACGALCLGVEHYRRDSPNTFLEVAEMDLGLDIA
jgi:hypothetical protein